MTDTRQDPLESANRAPADLIAKVVDLVAGVTGPVLDTGGDRAVVAALRAALPGLAVLDVGAGVGAEPPVLPVGDGAAGAALVPRVLHAVEDIDAVLAEVARALRPGGRVVVSANALGDLRELRGLWWAAARDCGVGDAPPFLAADERFPLDHAEAWLSRHFTDVVVTPLRSTAEFSAEAVLALVARERPSSAGVTWDLLASMVERKVRDVVAEDGAFTLTTITGVATGVLAVKAEAVAAVAEAPAQARSKDRRDKPVKSAKPARNRDKGQSAS